MSDYTVPDHVPDHAPERVPNDGDSHGEGLRASHAERDAALNALAAHYADGRLERAEFDERARVARRLANLVLRLQGHGDLQVKA